MAYGWGQVVGICVDTHVHRISNRLGWADTWNHKNTKAQNPEKTRRQLEGWMPREHWCVRWGGLRWIYRNCVSQQQRTDQSLIYPPPSNDHREEVNPLLVGLGQTVCRAISPKCHECSITQLCPSYIPPEACL